MTTREQHQPPDDWRRRLRRKIGWLLAFKLAALLILWMLFFSPANRVPVDAGVMSRHIAPAERSGERPASLPAPDLEDPDDA